MIFEPVTSDDLPRSYEAGWTIKDDLEGTAAAMLNPDEQWLCREDFEHDVVLDDIPFKTSIFELFDNGWDIKLTTSGHKRSKPRIRFYYRPPNQNRRSTREKHKFFSIQLAHGSSSLTECLDMFKRGDYSIKVQQTQWIEHPKPLSAYSDMELLKFIAERQKQTLATYPTPVEKPAREEHENNIVRFEAGKADPLSPRDWLIPFTNEINPEKQLTRAAS